MGEWDGGGHGCVGGVPCTYAHTCTCMLNMINMDASGNLLFLYMCLHAYACMCMHVVTPTMAPDAPRHPPPTCPLPRASVSQKHQNSISLELIEIFQFCLKILYL